MVVHVRLESLTYVVVHVRLESLTYVVVHVRLESLTYVVVHVRLESLTYVAFRKTLGLIILHTFASEENAMTRLSASSFRQEQAVGRLHPGRRAVRIPIRRRPAVSFRSRKPREPCPVGSQQRRRK